MPVPMPVLVNVDGTFGLPVVPEDLPLLEAAGAADVIRQLNELVNLTLLPLLAYPLPFKTDTKTRGQTEVPGLTLWRYCMM